MEKFFKKMFSTSIENNNTVIRILGIKFTFKQSWKYYFNFGNKIYLPYVETHLVDHCNLNCRGCTHFCPVSPEIFIDVEDFKKNMFELSKNVIFQQ